MATKSCYGCHCYEICLAQEKAADLADELALKHDERQSLYEKVAAVCIWWKEAE